MGDKVENYSNELRVWFVKFTNRMIEKVKYLKSTFLSVLSIIKSFQDLPVGSFS